MRRLIVGGILAFVWLWTTLVAGNVGAQESNVFDPCPDGERCLRLSEARHVTVENLSAVSELPVYAAPLLQIRLRLNETEVLPDPFYIDVGDYSLLPPSGSLDHCELMIVGAEQNGLYTRYYRVSRNTSLVEIRLYAFCRTLNLPGTSIGGLPFPSSNTPLDAELVTDVNPSDRALFDDVRHIVQRANTGVCGFSNSQEVTLKSLAAQFAVFIRTTPSNDRDTVWRRFVTEANNALYQDERGAIYCLLEEIGIVAPAFTPTPTPTETPTPGVPDTPTPASTPTPTPVPLVNVELPEVGATVGELMGVSLAGGIGFVLLMSTSVLVWNSRKRWRWLLFLLALAWALIAAFAISTSAQDAPSTVASPVMMVIVLDESRTMDGLSDNSARTSGGGKLSGDRRGASDPDGLSLASVEAILRELNSDPRQTHQVAVLSYARPNELQWLSGTNNENPFVSLGGGTPPDILDGLIGRLRQNRNIIQGPGDSAGAFETRVFPALQTRLGASDGRSYQPVIVHITDDVPIVSFDQSPWGNSPSNWRANARLDAFERGLANLANADLYDGACPGVGRGLQMITFSLGAANWIRSDGTLRSQAALEANPDEGLESEYFMELSRRIGSVRMDGSPMVYRIDPTFRSTAEVRDGFSRGVSDMMANLRCQWRLDNLELVPNTPLGTVAYSLPVSDFYDQLSIHIVAPTTQIEITDANGTTINTSPNTVIWGNRSRLQWTLSRADFPEGAWGGEWRINFRGVDTNEIDLAVYADLGFEGLSATISSRTTNLTPGQNTDLIVALLREGQPIRDTQLIEAVNAQLSRAVEPVVLERTNDGLLRGIIPAESVREAGEVSIDLNLSFRTQPGALAPQFLALRSIGNLSFSSGFSFGAPEPASGISWDVDCYLPAEDDERQVDVSISFSAEADQFDSESIGNYTRVEVYYPGTQANTDDPTPTPLSILRFDRVQGNRFEGFIPCELLMPGANQSIRIRAAFPGDGQAMEYSISFSLSTLTPSPTPTTVIQATETPLPAATVTPTPTPPDPNLMASAVQTLTTPPVTGVYFLILVVGGFGFVWVGGRTLYYALFPLKEVAVFEGDNDTPLMTGTRREEIGITDEQGNILRLFTLTAQQAGTRVVITPLVNDLIIEGNFVPIRQAYISGKNQIRVEYGARRYLIINRRGINETF